MVRWELKFSSMPMYCMAFQHRQDNILWEIWLHRLFSEKEEFRVGAYGYILKLLET